MRITTPAFLYIDFLALQEQINDIYVELNRLETPHTGPTEPYLRQLQLLNKIGDYQSSLKEKLETWTENRASGEDLISFNRIDHLRSRLLWALIKIQKHPKHRSMLAVSARSSYELKQIEELSIACKAIAEPETKDEPKSKPSPALTAASTPSDPGLPFSLLSDAAPKQPSQQQHTLFKPPRPITPIKFGKKPLEEANIQLCSQPGYAS